MSLFFSHILKPPALPVAGHIPVASVALFLGIDRFMGEGQAITNITGNTVATIIIAKSENEIDMTKALQIGKKIKG